MLLLLKAFDVIFFDWVLLCNAGFNFFTHFYLEIKAVLGRYLFGYLFLISDTRENFDYGTVVYLINSIYAVREQSAA